jgi:hypothetical protein
VGQYSAPEQIKSGKQSGERVIPFSTVSQCSGQDGTHVLSSPAVNGLDGGCMASPLSVLSLLSLCAR